MDIYLTDKATGVRLRLPMLPESIKEHSEAEVVSQSSISRGEYARPRGEQLKTYKWSGILPGKKLLTGGGAFIFDWQNPAAIAAQLKRYQSEGTCLALMVTETSINIDVFINSFDSRYEQGNGSIRYDIALCEWKNLSVEKLADEHGDSGDDTGNVYYKVKITTPYAAGYSRIYKSTSTSSTVLKKLRNGTEVLYLDGNSYSKWAKCAYEGITGWMWKANITFSRKG